MPKLIHKEPRIPTKRVESYKMKRAPVEKNRLMKYLVDAMDRILEEELEASRLRDMFERNMDDSSLDLDLRRDALKGIIDCLKASASNKTQITKVATALAKIMQNDLEPGKKKASELEEEITFDSLFANTKDS